MPETPSPAVISLPGPDDNPKVGASNKSVPQSTAFWKQVISLLDLGLPSTNIGSDFHNSSMNFEDAIMLAMIAKGAGSALVYGMKPGGSTNEMRTPNFPPLMEDLCRGSAEERLQRIRLAVYENQATFGPHKAFPIATFDHHVLVANSNRDLYRVTLDETQNQVRFAAIEKVGVRTIEEEDDTVSRGLSDTVQLFMEGKSHEARTRLFSTLSTLGASHRPWGVRTEAALRRMPSSTKEWRKYVRENRARLRRQARINETKEVPAPHYRHLYTDKNPNLAGARKTLGKDVKAIRAQIENLLIGMQRSMSEGLAKFAFRAAESGLNEQLLKLTNFSNDVIADLEVIREIMEMADSDADPVGTARIYDSVAENLSDILLAGRFIEATARELTGLVETK